MRRKTAGVRPGVGRMLLGMDKLKPVHVAVIEEGQGVSEEVWKAVERMCADPGGKGKILFAFAPTDAHLKALREQAFGGVYYCADGSVYPMPEEDEIEDVVLG